MIAGENTLDASIPIRMPLVDDYQLLIGHPPASDFFHFVRTLAAGGEEWDTTELLQDWRAANARVRELRSSETKLAEQPDLRELPENMHGAAALALEDAVRRGYQLTPGRWMLVGLDNLMVFQKRINLSWVAQLDAALGMTPSDRELVDFAAGNGLPRPSIQVVRSDDGTYTLSCSSGELRFFGPRLLDPSLSPEPRVAGDKTHLIGLFVGMGFNFLSALHYRNRLVLTNGTHRAYTLRSRGFTHAPCLVIDVEHEDDLDLAGVREVRSQIERYVRVSRPPLFKDYFDPALRKTVPVPRSDHALQIQIVSKTLRIPAAM